MSGREFIPRRPTGKERNARLPSRINNITIHLSKEQKEQLMEAAKEEEGEINVPISPKTPDFNGFSANEDAHKRLDFIALASKTWRQPPADKDLIVRDMIEYEMLSSVIRPFLEKNQSYAIADLQKSIQKIMRGTFRK